MKDVLLWKKNFSAEKNIITGKGSLLEKGFLLKKLFVIRILLFILSACFCKSNCSSILNDRMISFLLSMSLCLNAVLSANAVLLPEMFSFSDHHFYLIVYRTRRLAASERKSDELFGADGSIFGRNSDPIMKMKEFFFSNSIHFNSF